MDTSKYVEIGNLISLYGALLTKRQLQVLNYYYVENYSLTEIADITKTSKQAVQDMMKKGESKLFDIEGKLHFMKKTQTNEEHIQSVLDLLSTIKDDSSEKEIYKIIEKVQKELKVIA